MEGKVDKRIVKSILVAFGIIVAILLVVGTILIIFNKQVNDAKENTEKRAACMNEGKCWINNECQICEKDIPKQNALDYINEVEIYVMLGLVDSDYNEIEEGTYTVKELSDLGVVAKGEKPSSTGIVTIDYKGAVEEASLEFGNYKVYYDGKDAEIVK